ncbi:MAG: response regulator [bacterium]|jgi:two-component system response regulator NreC
MRILLADDHAMFRQGIRIMLEHEGFSVVAEAADGLDAVTLSLIEKPDVAVVDVMMPGLNGIEAARRIRSESPGTRVLVLSMHGDRRNVLDALRAGAAGYVLKDQDAGALIEAIREVARGNTYLCAGTSESVMAGPTANGTNGAPLSTRERQVLQLIAEGNATKEIAARLGLSVKTAESHRGRVMAKLGIHDVAGLVRYAIRHGMIQP